MRVAQFSGIYGNLTMATVEAALASLHTELNSIAVTLAGLQVTPSQLDTLNSTVIQVRWVYSMVYTLHCVGGVGVQP